MLEIAPVVTHKKWPGSYGYVENLKPLKVVWDLGGRRAHNHGPCSEAQEVNEEDLEVTTCPGCGEDRCWCGIGR